MCVGAESSLETVVDEPFAVAGIGNFGWVEPRVVARGQQPPLELETFDALRLLGVRAVLSLRPDREPPPRINRRNWPEYCVEDERRLVERSGLRFHHVPLADFSAPAPDEMAMALTLVDHAVAEAPALYVHCRAGAGRAALVTSAWSIANGRSGDHAAAVYERFMRHLVGGLPMTPDEWPAMLQRVGQPYVWWALGEIASALGSPVTFESSFLLPRARPTEADTWPRSYDAALQPWRDRRNV
jgi:protein tyrosine phosphatase (PTP) superfamily phosphohydrolase (DUF442 family)